jgi:hypothetical protein
MFRNTVTASLLLFIALVSVSLSAKATPPEPLPNTPPLALVR